MKMRSMGRFLVQVYPHDRHLALLRAAQEGCAVMHCSYLGFRDCYEVIADHPEFDPVPDGKMCPTYRVIFDDRDGDAPKRVRFELDRGMSEGD